MMRFKALIWNNVSLSSNASVKMAQLVILSLKRQDVGSNPCGFLFIIIMFFFLFLFLLHLLNSNILIIYILFLFFSVRWHNACDHFSDRYFNANRMESIDRRQGSPRIRKILGGAQGWHKWTMWKSHLRTS